MSSSERPDTLRRLKPVAFWLAALLLFFVLDRTAAAGLQALLRHSDHRIARIYAGGRSDEVVILGTSVAKAFVWPRMLTDATDRTVFSMAMHGLDARTQNALARDYLKANGSPRLALIDIRTLRGRHVRAPEFMLFGDEDSRIVSVAREHSKTRVPWADVFHTLRINSPLLPDFLQRLVDRDDQDTGLSDGRINKAIVASWQRNAVSLKPETPQINAFVSTVEAFRAAGTIPVVVVAPLHPSARFQAQDGIAELRSVLPSHVMVCNFSEAFSDYRFFEDPAHLNGEGRAAFLPLLSALVDKMLADLPLNRVHAGGANPRLVADRTTASAVEKMCGLPGPADPDDNIAKGSP